jgi:type VI protein secretion system component VasF
MIDTLTFARRVEAAGFPREQAEAMAEVLAAAVAEPVRDQSTLSAYARRLQAAGMPQEQAEALVAALAEALDEL